MYSFLESLELKEEASIGFGGRPSQSHEVEGLLELHPTHHDQVGEDKGGRTRFACETIGGGRVRHQGEVTSGLGFCLLGYPSDRC